MFILGLQFRNQLLLYCYSQWSYAVLLWEIFTKGGMPYQGLESLDIIEYLERGGRLSKPRLTPDVVCVIFSNSFTNVHN